MFTKSPEAVYTIFAGMLLCNLVMILAGCICAKFFSELMRVPENIMGAFIIMFCLVGACALRNDNSDLWYMVFFGIGGYFMRCYSLPVPPLVLGVILGPLAERYFLTTMIGANNDVSVFFTRPVSGSLIAVLFAMLCWPMVSSFLKKRRVSKSPVPS